MTAQISDPYENPESMEFGFRKKRFAPFVEMVHDFNPERRPVSILDLGGTETYWMIARDLFEKYHGRIHVTIVNNEPVKIKDARHFSFICADAKDKNLLDGEQFDIVHSNSVIEHVGNWEAILNFRDNVHRLGKRHFIQTPNYWFPVEPHFRFVGFHWLPLFLRAWLLRNRRCGFYLKEPDFLKSREIVDSIKLITGKEMRHLFSDSRIVRESFGGLTKSFIAIR